MTAPVFTMESVSANQNFKPPMSIHIKNNGNSIRATGDDANALFIALASDQALEDWDREGHGSENFRRAVKEALAARRASRPEDAEIIRTHLLGGGK